ncbi:hypothetical protein [Paenarthrobacter sp. NCHU4564]|uniref:hypothetical protein n=1 Tax=Paenarthrobacter sp. NCHU4564 TaxID=3451353 RepID=UPI003F99E2C7
MPTELSETAARLGIDLGTEQTKDRLLSAIDSELKDLQVPQPTTAQHERQVALMKARAELKESASAQAYPSTDLVPLSLVSQLVEAIQTSAAKEPRATESRQDPTLTMRTNVKAAATQASADFTKARSWPFAGAGALILSAYGLRTYFNVGDLQLPSEFFYPFLIAATLAIVIGFGLSTVAQRQATLLLRRLYDPDVQEEALNRLSEESYDFFGSHSEREFSSENRHGRSPRAVDDGHGVIINRPMYRDALQDTAHGGSSILLRVLSTVDLEAAVDDAAGLALDRLSDLKIVEPVIYQRRQAFRIVPESGLFVST